MVMRESKQLSAPAITSQQVQQSSVGNVAQDTNKFAAGGPSTTDRLLGVLLPAGQKLASQAFQNGLEEQYLSGVTQAATVKSEADLETQPLTSDWTKAGYRDTIARSAVAKQQAQLAADLPTLAEGTPEEFQQYQAQRRAELLPQLEGMSRTQRAAMFGQMAQDSVADAGRYTAARTAHVLAVEQKSIRQGLTARLERMEAAKGSLPLYEAEARGFVTELYKSTLVNPKLTKEMRDDMIAQAAEFAAKGEHVMVYEMLKTQRFAVGGGKPDETLFDQLDYKTQIKIQTAQDAALTKVASTRSSGFEVRNAAMLASWADDTVPVTQTFEEVNGYMDEQAAANLLPTGKHESMLKAWAVAKARDGSALHGAGAWAGGNIQEMSRLGLDDAKGAQGWMKLNKDMPVQQQVETLGSIAASTGSMAASKQVGAYAGQALRALGASDTIDVGQATVAYTAVQMSRSSPDKNPYATARMLEGVDPEQRALVGYMQREMEAGVTDPVMVINNARAKAQYAIDNKDTISAYTSAARKADETYALSLDYDGWVGQAASGVAGWFGGGQSTEQKLMPDAPYYFGTSDAQKGELMRGPKLALTVELKAERDRDPFASDAQRQQQALANLDNRTLRVAGAPLIMPKGSDIYNTFNVPKGTAPFEVEEAIASLVPVEGNTRVAYAVDSDNRLTWTKIDQDGKNQGSGTLNAADVAARVADQLEQRGAEANELEGAGVTVTKGEHSVTFNGQNTYGADLPTMLQLRKDIVESEGITNQSYADGKGGATSFGVGVNTGNSFTEKPEGAQGQYTQQQIDRSFNKASNAALGTATSAMKSAGVSGKEWTLFFGELAYQRPATARDPSLLAAVKLGDKPRAIQALLESPVFKDPKVPDERKGRYLKKLNDAMR